MGNCEESLAADAGDCGCGFAEESACAALSGEWYPYAASHVDAETRRWLGTLPRHTTIDIAGARLLVVHGAVTSINRFVFAASDAAIDEELAASGCDGVIAGHCGLPFTRERHGRLWHNGGVVGMPANDGTPRTWFSLLTPTADGILVEHLPLACDHESAAAKMRANRLPEGYAACLSTGLWPSRDILTPAELPATGRPLDPKPVLWRRP
jgi:hypothetical protein